MAQNKRKLSAGERVVGIARVAAIAYKASPLAVVEQGTHAELVTKDGVYCRLFESQMN